MQVFCDNFCLSGSNGERLNVDGKYMSGRTNASGKEESVLAVTCGRIDGIAACHQDFGR
jgi:hypothetical protein